MVRQVEKVKLSLRIQSKKFNLPVSYTIVSEAGASVYSASKLAIEEFPDLHVEQKKCHFYCAKIDGSTFRTNQD